MLLREDEGSRELDEAEVVSELSMLLGGDEGSWEVDEVDVVSELFLLLKAGDGLVADTMWIPPLVIVIAGGALALK